MEVLTIGVGDPRLEAFHSMCPSRLAAPHNNNNGATPPYPSSSPLAGAAAKLASLVQRMKPS